MILVYPKNTQYNRKHDLIDRTGTILGAKNGQVYFCFELKETVYFKCSEEVLKKQFDTEITEYPVLKESVLKDLRIKCRNYPK